MINDRLTDYSHNRLYSLLISKANPQPNQYYGIFLLIYIFLTTPQLNNFTNLYGLVLEAIFLNILLELRNRIFELY